MKKLFIKLGDMLACFALMVTTLNINTTCMMYSHQPKMPKKAQRLRRF
ncbi:cyclic lactone autoinducer peptide [Lacrimispora indolis]|nr:MULTISPECIES: cyclic lactone autoinducer peptide [Lachnospiraceae]